MEVCSLISIVFVAIVFLALTCLVAMACYYQYKGNRERINNLEKVYENYPIGKKIKYFDQEMTVIKNTEFYPYVGRCPKLTCRYKTEYGDKIEIIEQQQFVLIQSI